MKRFFVFILAAILLLGVIVPASLAWLNDSTFFQTSMNSYLHKSYFQSGDGTGATHYSGTGSHEGCAFEIKYPVQLYYFAWLQYLGYFNQAEENSTSIRQVYFWLSDDLDMTGWILPPIGTSEYPFVGNFDGDGHTITNLTVQNVKNSSTSEALSDIPVNNVSNVEIIGFFGVIGSLNNAGTVNAAVPSGDSFAPTAGYSYESSVNAVHEFTIDGFTVKTETDNALIGAVAGYVNGTVDHVAVSDTDISVDSGTGVLTYTANISDYALVGYCTDQYKYTLNVSKVTLHAPGETQNVMYKNIQGEGAGFGGSIKMNNLFSRLSAIRTSAGSNSTRTTAETVTVDEVNGTSVTVVTGTENLIYRQRVYNSTAGSFSFSKYSSNAEGGNNTDIMYLYGRDDDSYTKTVTTVTLKDEYEDGYLISDGTNYLCINGNLNGIVSKTDAASANGWVISGNRIYTYGNDGNKYYLNASSSGALSVSTTASTSWSWSGNHAYFSSGENYYLIYNDGWRVVEEYFYVISDGKGNYLRYNGSLNNVTNVNDASHWTFSSTGANPGGYISTDYNGTTYYLRYNNGLTVTTATNNRTSWTNNGTSLYNGSNYIKFNGTAWTAGARGTYYAIHNGANYLNITAANGTSATIGTGTSVTDISSDSGHTLWTFSTTGGTPSGTISTSVGGTTYYLRDNDGTLAATTAANPTSWSNSGSALSWVSDYIEFDGDWHIRTVLQTIHSGNNYLNITAVNGATATLGTGNDTITDDRESNRTMWMIDSDGYIYANYNGTAYYLRNNNGMLTATSSTSDRTSWTVNGSSISNGNTYLSYQSYVSKWVLLPYPSYTINRGGTYLNLTGTSATSFGSGTSVADWTDSSGHTIWCFSTTGDHPSGTIYTMYNGTKYYLYSNSNTLNISSTNSTSWTNSNNSYNRLSYSSGSGWNSSTYYLYYRNNNWGVGTSTRNSRADMTLTSITQPTIAFSAGSAPSVTVTSETEPAPHAQPVRIDSDLTDIVRTPADVQVTSRAVTTEPSGYPADTIIPLNVNGTSSYNAENDSIEASDSNTGYIVSGSNYHASSGTTTWPYRSGDIRVSKYAMTSISNSTNQAASTYGTTQDSRLEIITAVNYGSYSGFYRVSDSYNQNNSNVNTTMSNAVANNRKISYQNLGFKRYEDARAALSSMFLNQSNIYGLHFMDAAISKDDCAILSHALINGEDYYDYPVPRNSIDFNVKRRGFITVFAGTYFSGNNAFFSLHEIVRYTEEDAEVIQGTAKVNDIKSIKEIREIYKAASGSDYIYKYADNSYSSNDARGDLVFNLGWMTDTSSYSTWVNNAVYYFEIPVNAGEYALGSVSGKDGAYLFYLDIAANAGNTEEKNRVTVSEKIRDETYSVDLPAGVQLVESGNAYDENTPYELAGFALENGYSGDFVLERTGNTVTYDQGAHTSLGYLGATLSVSNSSGQGYIYYPNGYEIQYIEHITDEGIDTHTYDHIVVKTVDSYNSSGTRTSRTVSVYADIENVAGADSYTVDESLLDLIVTFTYNPSGHDSMKTRVVRAASDGGFNISFNENVTLISATVDDANVHVNFGDNTATTLITASASAPLAANTAVAAVNMEGTAGGGELENTYYGSVFSDTEIATYSSYYEGSGANSGLTRTTTVTMEKLEGTSAAQSRSLTYTVTLTAGAATSDVTIFARKLANSYTYSTKVKNDGGSDPAIIDSGTITVSSVAVSINGNSIGTESTEITISAD